LNLNIIIKSKWPNRAPVLIHFNSTEMAVKLFCNRHRHILCCFFASLKIYSWHKIYVQRMIYYIILNCLSNYISRNGNYYGTKINNHLLCIVSMCMDNHYYFYIIFVNPFKPEKNTFYFSYLYEKLGSSHILYVILLCLMYIAIYNILYYIYILIATCIWKIKNTSNEYLTNIWLHYLVNI